MEVYIMFKKDIDALFTSKIMEYINQGYIIHTNTMGGSQGELAKVDLYKGKDIIRIYTDHKYHGIGGHTTLVLTIGRNKNKIYGNPRDIIWNKDLEIIEQLEFVELSDNYFVTPDEFKPIKEKQMLRYKRKQHYECQVFNDSAKKIVLSFMKRQPKCKTIRLSDIERVYKVVDSFYRNPNKFYARYYVRAKNDSYQIK